jgi:hypothetical protein
VGPPHPAPPSHASSPLCPCSNAFTAAPKPSCNSNAAPGLVKNLRLTSTYNEGQYRWERSWQQWQQAPRLLVHLQQQLARVFNNPDGWSGLPAATHAPATTSPRFLPPLQLHEHCLGLPGPRVRDRVLCADLQVGVRALLWWPPAALCPLPTHPTSTCAQPAAHLCLLLHQPPPEKLPSCAIETALAEALCLQAERWHADRLYHRHAGFPHCWCDLQEPDPDPWRGAPRTGCLAAGAESTRSGPAGCSCTVASAACDPTAIGAPGVSGSIWAQPRWAWLACTCWPCSGVHAGV